MTYRDSALPRSVGLLLVACVLQAGCAKQGDEIDRAEKAAGSTSGAIATKDIVKEAYIYGFPMLMNYGVMRAYFIDRNSGQFKAPLNQIYNEARVFTPADTAIITPNSDTPYSFIGMDLRAQPIVICVPKVEKTRYYDVQLVDMYTFNYGYIGSRATGNVNTQGQPALVWPTTFALAGAYVDQLERSKGLSAAEITSVRASLASASQSSGSQRQQTLTQLAAKLDTDAGSSTDGAKVRTLAGTVRSLASS
jgi:hypothetical protein